MAKAILTPIEWVKCSAVLTAGTGKKLTPEQNDVWYECFQDISFPVLKAACRRALQESESGFLPPIAMIRRFASEGSRGALPESSEEWEHVRKMVRKWGYPRRVEAFREFSDITQTVVSSLGWDALCDMTDPTFMASQFRKAYDELATRESSHRRLSVEIRPRITGGDSVVVVDRQVAECTKRLTHSFEIPKE